MPAEFLSTHNYASRMLLHIGSRFRHQSQKLKFFYNRCKFALYVLYFISDTSLFYKILLNGKVSKSHLSLRYLFCQPTFVEFPIFKLYRKLLLVKIELQSTHYNLGHQKILLCRQPYLQRASQEHPPNSNHYAMKCSLYK